MAALIGAQARDVVWTSGATESNNLAITGAALAYQDKGRHLITLKTEHKAVLDTMRALEQQGFAVTFLDVQPNGLVDLSALQAAMRPDTILVSVMAVNNEIGVVHDSAAIGQLCRQQGVLFHVDVAQATGKVALDVQAMQVDLMSLASHKTYGPKGIGALYVRRQPRVRLQAQMHGGGHERGLRSGTLPTHQIVGMGEAFRLAHLEMAHDNAHARQLQQQVLAGLADVPGVVLNGDATQRVPHNLNFSFAGIRGRSAHDPRQRHRRAVQRLGLHLGQHRTQRCAASLGAQPPPGTQQFAHQLQARFSTEADIAQALACIRSAVLALQAISPLAVPAGLGFVGR